MSRICCNTCVDFKSVNDFQLRLRAMLDEFDVDYCAEPHSTQINLPRGLARFCSKQRKIELEAISDSRDGLESLRAVMEYYAAAIAGDQTLPLAWQGDVEAAEYFANFREMRVTKVEPLSTHMQRLTLTGEDLARFDNADEWHVRLHFPPQGIDQPEWPKPSSTGSTIWPPQDRRAEVRYYTLRYVNLVAQEVVIDFVLHDIQGPGSDFARAAKVGDIVGMAGPYGRCVPACEHYLLAGDETAIPAIARYMDTLPSSAKIEVWLEVGSADERLHFDLPANCCLQWCLRNEDSAQPFKYSQKLVDTLLAAMPSDVSSSYVWFAGELSESQRLRKTLKQRYNLDKEQVQITGYWKSA